MRRRRLEFRWRANRSDQQSLPVIVWRCRRLWRLRLRTGRLLGRRVHARPSERLPWRRAAARHRDRVSIEIDRRRGLQLLLTLALDSLLLDSLLFDSLLFGFPLRVDLRLQHADPGRRPIELPGLFERSLG